MSLFTDTKGQLKTLIHFQVDYAPEHTALTTLHTHMIEKSKNKVVVYFSQQIVL